MGRVALLALLLPSLALSQDEKKAKVVRRLPTPQDALTLAHADALWIYSGKDKIHGPHDLAYLRYVWVRSGDIDDARAISGALHYTSRSNQVGESTRPVPLARGAVLRFDIRRYTRSRSFHLQDIGDWLKSLEELRYDLEFNTVVTPDTVRLAHYPHGVPTVKTITQAWEDKPRTVPRYFQDGVPYTQKWFKRDVTVETPINEVKDIQPLLNPNGAPVHLDPMMHAALCELLQTQAPLVTAGYFVTRTQSTIQEQGLHGILYGGIYYELAGIPEVKDGNDELELYKGLGVNTGTDTLEEFFARLTSDSKAAIFFSKVTGRPRQMYWFPHPGTRGGGVVFVTLDPRFKNIDTLSNAMANLLDFKGDAKEVIFTKPNGFHGFALYDGKGKRQRFAPDDVVSDHTVPPPFRRTLQSAISCERCHAARFGLQDHDNDPHKVLAAGFNIVDKKDQDRLRELYAWDPKPDLEIGRMRLAQAVLKATGPWKGSKDQTDVARLLGDQIAKLYHEYNYELVTPALALRDLGFEVPEGDEEKWLKTLLLTDAADDHFRQRLGFVPQDFRLVGLMAGIPITRVDWQLAYSFAQARADAAWARIMINMPKKGGERFPIKRAA